jgi:hypothetical protein
MNANEDLDAIDRATLRVWRATNLVGWGLAGLGTFAAVMTIGIALARSSAWIAPILMVAPVVGCVAAGWVIGGHVYRSPALVTIGAFLIPGVAIGSAALLRGTIGPAELTIVVVPGVVVGALSALSALVAWRRRPGALRAS